MHFLLLPPSQKVILLVELFFSVCLSVCLWILLKKLCIVMKFCGGALGGVVKNRLDFGGDLGVLR